MECFYKWKGEGREEKGGRGGGEFKWEEGQARSGQKAAAGFDEEIEIPT